MPSQTGSPLSVCVALARAISRSRTVEEIYAVSLDALESGLGVSRSAILLFDEEGVTRFEASRGLSQAYRDAVTGNCPWKAQSTDAEPVIVHDVRREPLLVQILPAMRAENVAAVAFVPLVTLDGVIGKLVLYCDTPYTPSPDEVELARVIASQVAFAIARERAASHAWRSEARLRFALDAASTGTWHWDVSKNLVRWSDNLERIHGLPPGTFDGTFASYEREIHPDDRDRVLESIRRAIDDGLPHDVEYRIVAPDGTVRWVEGKGQVEYEQGRPVRMTGVCVNVTRRKEAERARLAAAEEAAALKDDFLATLSHELRTPLNAILGWVQLVQAGNPSSSRLEKAIDVIGRNARLQAQLIEDILDVSRIISGKLEIERVPVFMSQLIDTVVSGLAPGADLKDIRLVKIVPDDLPPIEGDPRRLLQVLGNVVSNAIKFTPPGGRVDVRAWSDGDAILIEVGDTGAGIAAEFLPHVFERFRQGDSRSTRKHGGLGLGLAIARSILDRHGGVIRATSDGAGRGTTVTIRIPIDWHLPAPPLGATPREVTNEVRLDGATVLVVDDQLDSRELLAATLDQCGATVEQCDSAAGALDALKRRRFDLLVADIAMPEIDGYELIRCVRQLDYEIPAIAVSAYARPEDRTRALAEGFRGYCAKPFEQHILLGTVRQVLGRA